MRMITQLLLSLILGFLLLAVHVRGSTPNPVVVLPPTFRWGAENEILVTPIQTLGTVNAHFKVEVRTVNENSVGDRKLLVFKKNIVTPRTDRPNSVTFNLDKIEKFAKVYEVTVDVERNEKFVGYVYGTPNVRTIEVQTDKVFYKKGEVVKVRALPITEDGQLYKGEISFNIWNPRNFKLQTKNASAAGRFIDVEFKLPDSLRFGEWKIVAIPNDPWGRAMTEPSMHYAVTFEVQDYVLPQIQVLLDAKITKDTESPMFSVSARFAHGTLVNGTVKIRCMVNNSSQDLTTLTMLNGFVSSHIKVSQCFPDKSTTSTTVTATVRDKSTSRIGETRYELDIRVAGFDLVPLRPAFSDRAKQFYVYVKPTGSPFEDLPDVVHMNVTCLSSSKQTTNEIATYKSKIGEVVGIEGRWSGGLSGGFHPCSAIIIFAQREISNAMLSRNVTLMIANMSSATSTNFNLIDPESPTKTGYRVGEEFRATVSHVASEYMVVCNMHDVAAYGRVDHSKIRFTVTEKMIPQCVLYVYSVDHSKNPAAGNPAAPTTDMWLFFVENSCRYSSTPDKNEISPSDKLKISIEGPRDGTALLHIVDTRMFGLLQRSVLYSPSTYWELESFGAQQSNRLRMMNFLDDSNLKFVVGKVCREGGSYFGASGLTPCPSAGRSSSGISNYCQQQVMKGCEGFHQSYKIQNLRVSSGDDVQIASVFKIVHVPQSATPLVADLAAPALGRQLMDDGPVPGQPAYEVKVRQHFPEVWLFSDIKLDASGKARTTLKSPDSIANWSIASTFWGPGHFRVCRPNPASVISKKEFYMIVNLPKHIYVNETISADIDVTTETQFTDDYMVLSVCITGVAYQTCVDQGVMGELGQEIYNQVNLTRSTRSGLKKTAIYFTKPGKVELVFSLRRQENIHVHHCMEGKIEDQVKLTIDVEKRAETELSYKGIIISPDKPLKETSPVHHTSEKIDYDQQRYGATITTNIHLNLGESEPQSLSLELSKFIPTAPFDVPKSLRDEKRKLGILPTRNLFLSEVLEDLSVNLYRMKSLQLNRQKSLADIEEAELLDGEITALVSDMNTFSNCTETSESCGFAEYGVPKSDDDISIPLTAVSVMLLCQHGVEPEGVKGPIELMFSNVRRALKDDREIDDILRDLPRKEDRRTLLQALLYQVVSDCPENFRSNTTALYSHMKDLYTDIFMIDHISKFDPRVIASLAYMSLTTTHDRARLQLNKRIRRNLVPFWNFNTTCQDARCEEKESPNDVRQFFARENEKRNEVLLNSLGLLAYTKKGIINKSGGSTNLDHLADWIYEQKQSSEGYYSALDTFFASRALYEYRSKHNSAMFFGNPTLEIQFKLNDSIINMDLVLDDNPILVPIPGNVTTVKVLSGGDAKIKLGVQLVAWKRQRSKRHTQDEHLPVKITCTQYKVTDAYLRQEVCVQVKSRFLKTLQIDHALYTGFTSERDKFQLLSKSKADAAKLVGDVEFSDIGAHFILTNLSPDAPTCYQLGVSSTVDEPSHLAPVALSAISKDTGVVGELFISHPDVYDLRKLRRRRQNPMIVQQKENEGIDKVCFEGGECSCAEANCRVKCTQCEILTPAKLETEMEKESTLACTLEVREDARWHNTSKFTDGKYIVIPVVEPNGKQIDLWLRECNKYSYLGDDENPLSAFRKNDWVILVGNKFGSVVDSQQRRHYILTNNDYFEKDVKSCDLTYAAVAKVQRKQCTFN